MERSLRSKHKVSEPPAHGQVIHDSLHTGWTGLRWSDGAGAGRRAQTAGDRFRYAGPQGHQQPALVLTGCALHISLTLAQPVKKPARAQCGASEQRSTCVCLCSDLDAR